jgi:putative polyhydroxyalkanoic acid system protein
MRITVPHNTDKTTARQRIEERLHQVLATYGHYLSEAKHYWEGDRLVFSGKAKGMKASGTVDITENEVIIDGKLPLLAKPFEPRIKSTIEREAEAMFRGA